MKLTDKINEDIKTAMKAKDSARLNVLRMLKSALKYAAIEKLGADASLDDPDALLVVRKQIKQRQDSVASYAKANRPDLAETEKNEIVILESYLPTGLTAQEIETIVKSSIAEIGATSKAQMGAVMKLVTQKADGRADGRSLSAEVQKHLA